MVDSLTPAERSKRMSRIRSSNTSPERALRSALHGLGLRYSLKNKELPGKPDVAFPRKKLAVFVHGCFWHRHENCSIAHIPKSNTSFWTDKFDRNVSRDRRVHAELVAIGWKVCVVWECELGPRQIASTAARVADVARSIG